MTMDRYMLPSRSLIVVKKPTPNRMKGYKGVHPYSCCRAKRQFNVVSNLPPCGGNINPHQSKIVCRKSVRLFDLQQLTCRTLLDAAGKLWRYWRRKIE